MKVYFTCSARGTDELNKNYELIYSTIEKCGHTHIDDYRDEDDPNEVYGYSQKQRVQLYDKAIRSIKKADIVVLEVSIHSLTMGYLLHTALDLSKPVIALHVPHNAPVFATGIDNEKLQVLEYTPENVHEVISAALDYADDQQDTRFNFFISPRIGNYLDWISKQKRIPRAVYLRRLIEEDMDKNKDLVE